MNDLEEIQKDVKFRYECELSSHNIDHIKSFYSEKINKEDIPLIEACVELFDRLSKS